MVQESVGQPVLDLVGARRRLPVEDVFCRQDELFVDRLHQDFAYCGLEEEPQKENEEDC